MALQSDSRGFLVGDPIDLKRMPNDISYIRDDVSAIRRAISERWRDYSRADRAPRQNAVMPERGANGRFVSKASPAVATPTGPRRGDSNLAARFAGNAKVAIALPAARSAGVVSSIAARLESADPSVKAAREIAEPLQRGLELFRGGDKQTSWLKKIFKSLNIFHKEDTVYNKAAKKSLKAIEEKSVMGGGVYRSGSLVDKIPGLATIAKTGIGGGLLGLLTKAGRGARGLFKRIPVIGSLLAGAGAAFDIFGSENDDTLSRQDKDKAAGKAIGGWTGSLGGVVAGAAAGSALGPVGTIVGGVVGGFLGDQAGQVIGEKFGDWVNDLRNADIPGKITAAWDSAVSAMSKTFNEAWAKVKDIGGLVMDVIREQLGGFADYIKGVTGIDLKQQGAAWMDRTKANIKQAASSLADQALQGVDFVSKNSTIGKAIGKVATSKSGGEIGSPELAMQLLMQKGWSKEDAAAIAANLNSESLFDTRASGDNGQAIGAAQWHPDRQKIFEGQFGKKLADASFEEQIAFVDWELRNTEKKAGNAIRSASGVKSKTAAFEQFYERSALGQRGGVQPERIADAIKYAAINVSGAPIAQVPKAPPIPPIAEAPKVVEPLSSTVTPQFTVNIPSQDVGQTVRDPTTAYIASGGVHKRP